jgi:hypothetical protein
MKCPHRCSALIATAFLTAACDEVPDEPGGAAEGGNGAGDVGGAGGENPYASGTPFDIDTSAGPVYVDVDGPALVDAAADWDLLFDGARIFTNGGVSGAGKGAAMGPFDASEFAGDTVPAGTPFLIEDREGGPFLDWYAYDDVSHALYSRYHVHGVRRGNELYKLQVLGYYGEAKGAPVSALYQLRLARVTGGGAEETVLVEDVDGTAGGPNGDENDPSGCLRLSTLEQSLLTPAEALASPDWDLCFRRDVITINGGTSGSAGVTAVDLMALLTSAETLDQVKTLTAASQLAAFDAVGEGELAAPPLPYASDGIVSAFTSKWLDIAADPLEVAPFTWLVAAADGETPYFVAFEGLTDATSTSPGTVHMRVKAIGGALP